MSTIKIINAVIYKGGKLVRGESITVKDGVICNESEVKSPDAVYDAKGNIACAGFIDAHTHGGLGKDCMEPTCEALNTISKYHLSKGVTSFCPTTMTADIADIESALENIRGFKSDCSRIAGVHLEGPFLSAGSAGAHPLDKLLNPDASNTAFIDKYADIVSRITVAPNLSGAPYLADKCKKLGIQVSMGHDNAIDDEIYAAIEAGASSVTHMYNCTSRPSRRTTPKKHLGLTEVGLIDKRVMCEVIADGSHVPDKLFDMIFKLKGADGICLVSDSLSVAGMGEGDYYLGSGESRQQIRIEDGVAILPAANTYAGSVTAVSEMVVSLAKRGYDIEDCLKMSTINPAKLAELTDRGDIKEGMLADINILDEGLKIIDTFLGGVKVG
ncbi:MAG: N-acetylglucosamine-6-phosphate deacetylase [Clostridia bacterium]|nr:N-acetylglucosamine-6-phosphate deacetylase [Clostridia bacterium]